MLPKAHRLTGNDIQYILRRGKKHYGIVFVISAVPQHPNNNFHQVTIQIPNKVDKRAAMRNLLKRHALVALEQALNDCCSGGPYQKLFVFINKKNIETWRPQLATLKKTAIVNQRQELCTKEFTLLLKKLGRR